MNPLAIRKSLDAAIDRLKELAFQSNSEVVTAKLRRAYKHLQGELHLIDGNVLADLESERAA